MLEYINFMVNTAKKGWRKERECRKILEEQGYKIVFKSIRWRWGTLDLAGLFDTLAVRKIVKNHEPKLEWLFISNKHSTNYRKAHYTLIQAFIGEFGIEEGVYEVWVWNKPKWVGRGLNRHWQNARWEVISVTSNIPEIFNPEEAN